MQSASATLYCHLSPVWFYLFFKSSHKRHYIREKLLNTKMCFWLSLQLSFIRIRFSWNANLLHRFLAKTQISNATKIRPVGAELFHVGWGADRHDEGKSRFYAILRRRLNMSEPLLTLSLSNGFMIPKSASRRPSVGNLCPLQHKYRKIMHPFEWVLSDRRQKAWIA